MRIDSTEQVRLRLPPPPALAARHVSLANPHTTEVFSRLAAAELPPRFGRAYKVAPQQRSCADERLRKSSGGVASVCWDVLS